jgi:hypothetical protein
MPEEKILMTTDCLIAQNYRMRLKIEAKLLMRVARSLDSDKLGEALKDYELFTAAAARME